MDYGCPGCFTSMRGQQEEMQRIKKQALDYGKQNKITVAIYKEGFEYFYTEAGAAITAGYHTVDIIPYHS